MRRAGITTLILISVVILAFEITGCANGSGGSDDYTVTYHPNGATSGSVPVDSTKYPEFMSAIVKDNTGNLSKSGYSFANWNWNAEGTGPASWPGDRIKMSQDQVLYARYLGAGERLFTAIDATDNSVYKLIATLAAQGTRCIVYAENGSGVSSATAQAIATKFDTAIYNQITTNFGDFYDIDGNGKILLLLLDIRDGYSGSGGYIAGYFDPTHMFSASTYSASNQADMLFLDTYPSDTSDPDFHSTIAHEFQHLINFSRTYLVNEKEQDLWINEGLSSGAEYVYSGAVNADRVKWFNEDKLNTIKQGNNFFVWYGAFEDANSNAVLDNYATVSLFFQWLRVHASNGTGIYKEILDSSNSIAANKDYKAVMAAVAADFDVTASGSWEVLLRTWHIANILNSTSGDYGYKGATGLTTVAQPLWTGATGGQTLSPGEGIASAVAGSFTPATSGSSIKYVGITDASTIDTVGSTYDGSYALVFNANTDVNGSAENGYVSSTGSGPVASLAGPSTWKQSWKVDLQVNLGSRVPEINRRQLQKANRVLTPLPNNFRSVK